MDRRALVLGSAGCATLPFAGRAQAQGGGAGGAIRLGVLTDISGPFADIAGQGSVMATRLAAREATANSGVRVDVLAADHQNRPDVASNIARQ